MPERFSKTGFRVSLSYKIATGSVPLENFSVFRAFFF